MASRVAVLDTNVLVSGLINSYGAPGRIVDLILTGELVAAYDDRMMAEWWDVLQRDKFGFDLRHVTAFLNFVELEGQHVTPRPLARKLPDPSDVPFLEVADASEVLLVTDNTKHYPPEVRGKVDVMTPREFLDRWVNEF